MPKRVNAFKRTVVAVQLNCVTALGFGVKRRLLPRREAEGIINQLELVRVHARQLEHPIKSTVICVGGNRVVRNKPLKINFIFTARNGQLRCIICGVLLEAFTCSADGCLGGAPFFGQCHIGFPLFGR